MNVGSRSVVKSGRSVDEALEAALDELGVRRDEVDVEVLEEANKGLLGWIGGRLARIRVTVKASARSEAVSRPRRQDRGPSRAEVAETRVAGEAEPAAPAALDEEGERRAGDVLARARGFLKDMLKLVGTDGFVETRRGAPDLYTLNVVTQRAGLLIGHHGETLEAIQLLVNVAANRSRHDAWVRFVVDVGDYRKRREETLRNLAVRTARRVRAEGQRIALEPMTPLERRVIHLALKDDPYVQTRSEGEEPRRRVVVFPVEQGTGGPSEAPE